MLTGMPIIHAIRHYYGKGAAAFVGICLFLEGCECRIETAKAAADCHDRMLSVYPGNHDLRHLQEILKKRENCGNHSQFSFFCMEAHPPPVRQGLSMGCMELYPPGYTILLYNRK